MIKKTLTFKDLDGNEHTEDHYFNINKAELAKLELTTGDSGLVAKLQSVIEAQSGKEVIETFEWILSKAYGKRDPDDPKRFIKSPELWETFSQTGAYEEFFFEVLTNAATAANFVIQVLPEELREGLLKSNDPATKDLLEIVSSETPVETFTKPTDKDLREMSKAEIAAEMARLQEHMNQQ